MRQFFRRLFTRRKYTYHVVFMYDGVTWSLTVDDDKRINNADKLLELQRKAEDHMDAAYKKRGHSVPRGSLTITNLIYLGKQ